MNNNFERKTQRQGRYACNCYIYNEKMSSKRTMVNKHDTRGAESESESESPGVVATNQESESESESIKPPRLRLRNVLFESVI